MLSPPLKVVFAGTPEFAATHLQAIIDSNHQLCAVYTQPDRPAGRGQKLTISPVKQLALKSGLIVCQPDSLKSVSARQLLHSFEADLLVVVAYGIILPAEILAIPRFGCINVHASLLPRWRGAAPIQRAIEAGDQETGITIMQMDEGLDTGDMLMQSELTLATDETSASLHNRLMKDGAKLLIKALDAVAAGDVLPIRQDDSKACYAKKLTKVEASINWSLSAEEIDRKIRAFHPWPGCYVMMNNQKMNIIAEPSLAEHISETSSTKDVGKILEADKNGLRVCCAKGSLLITSLQLPGKKMTPITALLNAYQDIFQPGQYFDR